MDRFYAGDLFEVESKMYTTAKILVLARSIITKEHFYLISIGSFEPWNERVITVDNRFERAWITPEELYYLAETDNVTYLGNINSYKESIARVLSPKSKVA
ncbi:MAG: hypothetical protein N3C60_04285 [Calditerrivibrio sp.]|nr:hypothetical protein [Calditerrivibrio sp.]